MSSGIPPKGPSSSSGRGEACPGRRCFRRSFLRSPELIGCEFTPIVNPPEVAIAWYNRAKIASQACRMAYEVNDRPFYNARPKSVFFFREISNQCS